MEIQEMTYVKSDYIVTPQGNVVSKRAVAHGSNNISLGGSSILMTDVVLRGDLNPIKMGKFCIIKDRTIVRPPYMQVNQGAIYLKCYYGEYVLIEEDCVCEAVQVGSYVHIGAGSILGNSSVVKDCVYIKPGTVVAPNQVLENFAVYAGNPARKVEHDNSAEQMQPLMADAVRQYYRNFVPEPAPNP